MSKDSSSEGKSQDASTPDAPADAPAKDSNADLYENRGQKKLIRVVTVMAYLFSVSFVGILLSAYYIFLWEPPNPRLVQRERLRADPQMQFLIASPAEETTEDSSFLLQTEVKPFLSPRIMNDNDDSAVDPQVKINLEKKRRLNALLLKLWHSLVDAGRAQKRNSSQVTTNSGEFNNSFVEREFNSMLDRAENTISRYGESRGNTFEETTYSDNPDVELADSASTLDVESTSSTSRLTTIPETSQTRHDRDSIANVNPIIEKKKQYNRKKFDAVSSYLIRGLSYATTNSDITIGSDRRVSGDDDSSKVTRGFLRTDRKESMKQNETDDRRLINSNRENDSDDVQTNVILKECVNCNVRNSRENYSNESSSNNQVRQIARDGVSIDPPPSRDSGFTDDPGFQQTPDDLTVVKSRPRITAGTRNSEETQIERMTARSTTTDNKQLEQIDLSTTQRQKSIPEVFTEIADVEETSVEPTSISTARDYHNITSITSEDDESVT